MPEETIARIKCLRCGHEWYPRSTKLPVTCSKCRSPFWNIPKVRKSKKEDKGSD